MTKVSKSPERNTFQKEGYLKRCAEQGKEPSQAYLKFWDIATEEDKKWAEEEHKNDLEYDLRSTDWICDKVRASDSYAQNLYAAMCNMQFQKLDVLPILKEDLWSCSWRHSGGIIADMQMKGDYIDWYCSGMGDGLGNGDVDGSKGYVPEGFVTDEIKEDLKTLGWVPVPYEDDKNV